VKNERKRVKEEQDGDEKVDDTVEEEQKKFEEKEVENETKNLAKYKQGQREAEDGMEGKYVEEEIKE
jgi:hypothetical protein